MMLLHLAVIAALAQVYTAEAFAQQGTSPIKLWNSGTCPYAARIWVALIEKELRFELCGLDALALSQDTAHGQTKKVDLQNKSEGFVQTYQPSSNARAKVPVLQDGEFKIIESEVCVYYLEEAYPSHGTRLLPDTAVQRASMRLFYHLYQELVSSLQYQFIAVGKDTASLEPLKNSLSNSIVALNHFLLHNGQGSGPFLLGDQFSIAEVFTGPFIQRLLPLLSHFCDVNVIKMAQDQQCDRFIAWVEATIARPSVQAQAMPEEAANGIRKTQLVSGYASMIDLVKRSSTTT